MTYLHAGMACERLFKEGNFCKISECFSIFLPPYLLHTCMSIYKRMQECKPYSYLTYTHPHLVTDQTARQFHEIFPIWCSLVLSTCVTQIWYHTVSVSTASWFSFKMDWLCAENTTWSFLILFFKQRNKKKTSQSCFCFYFSSPTNKKRWIIWFFSPCTYWYSKEMKSEK